MSDNVSSRKSARESGFSLCRRQMPSRLRLEDTIFKRNCIRLIYESTSVLLRITDERIIRSPAEHVESSIRHDAATVI